MQDNHSQNPLWGLVLAAGSSQRMGQDKRQLFWHGKTILEHAVQSLWDGGIRSIAVVLEKDSPCQALPGLTNTTKVINPNPKRGMLSSVREGLCSIQNNAKGAVVLPGDHLFIPSKAICSLVEYFEKNSPLLLVPRYCGRRGHPLIISHSLFAQALSCDDTLGLRQLLRTRESDLHILDLEYPDADEDLDYPKDLKKLIK